MQQSAGQVDPAANLVAQEVQPSNKGANIQPMPAQTGEQQVQADALSSPELPPASGLYTVVSFLSAISTSSWICDLSALNSYC